VKAASGPAVLLYDGSNEGLIPAGRFDLSAEPTAFATGNLDGDGVPDVLILAGGRISILHGGSRTLEPVSVPFTITAAALGSFISDREPLLQMALLADDGSVHFFTRDSIDPRPHTLDELLARKRAHMNRIAEPPAIRQQILWKEYESFQSVGAADGAGVPPQFFRTRISSNGADDVMILGGGRLTVIAHPGVNPTTGAVLTRSEQVYSVISALPVRVNVDGRPGVVMLQDGGVAPFVMMPLPDPTFFVNRTDDPVPGAVASTCNNSSNADTSTSCSLREAIRKANATAGTDTVMLAAGTYTLSLARQASVTYDATAGALDVTDSVNIIGATDGSGNPASIIQAGTTSGNGVDMIFRFNPDEFVFTNATVNISNLVLKFGRNRGCVTGACPAQDGSGGAFWIDTGGTNAATATGSLTVTNCNIDSNQTTDGFGGGIGVFNTNHGSGTTLTLTNSTVQNNTAVRTAAGAVSDGGGIMVFFPAFMTATNLNVLNNSVPNNGGIYGAGGGIMVLGGGGAANSITLHGGTISGNTGAGQGGGIYSTGGLTIDQGAVISSNISAGQGGGIWFAGHGDVSPEPLSLTKVTFTGNTAQTTTGGQPGVGGGVYIGNGGQPGTISFSRFAANTAVNGGSNLYNDPAQVGVPGGQIGGGSVVTAQNNWWGTNAASTTIFPPTSTCAASFAQVCFDPFIVLTHTSSPKKIRINQSATLTGDMSKDNHGSGAALSGNLNPFFGLPITFNNAVLGSIPQVQPEVLGNPVPTATATFNAGNTNGRGSANATVDQAIVSVNSNLIATTTEAGTTVTITTVGAHGLTAGDYVSISGVGVGGYNGNFFKILSATTTTFTYTGPAGLGASSGGTANAGIIILQPPSMTKSFSPTTVPTNTASTLTFSLTNPNVVPIDSSFTDSLPAGLVVGATPNVTNTCGGATTATAGTGTISFSNANLPVGTCTITVNVTSSIDNIYNNSVTLNSSDAGNATSPASASLTVINPPQSAKAFGAATIPLNGTTTLTITLTSSNQNLTLNGVAFTDSLPAGLVVATPSGVTTTCNGTLTATDGSSSVSLSGATLAPGASCTASLNVQGTTAGVKNNSVQTSSTNGGTGNTANASITVVAPPTISKAFGAASIPLNGTTTVTFTISNPNTAAAGDLTGVAFTDTLPSTTGTLVIAGTPGVSNTCNGTVTATAGAGVISLSGGSVAHNTSCTLTVNVTGTAGGDANNTTGAISSTEGGTGAASNTATLKIVAPPTVSKAFGAATISLNGTTTLTFTITNPASNTAAENGIAFSDTLTNGLQVASTPGVSNTCGGTVTAAANSTTISITGGSIATPGATCTIVVNVTGTQAGSVSNTTGAVSSTNGGTGATSNTATLAVITPPTIAKAFGAAQIPNGGTTSLTFTIQNPNAGNALSGVAFTDNLPAGLVVASTPNLNNACGGTATAVGGSGSVSLSAGTIATNSSCTVSVDVQGATSGVKNNSVQVTSTNGGTGNTSNASITVFLPPVIIKAFGAASIPLNGSTSLSFTIQNNNTTTALSGVAFSDTLPAGLVISTPNGQTGSCGAGTITDTQATNVISLAGGTIAASSSCTFSVNVTGTAAGLQNNTTGNVTSTEGGTGGTASAIVKVEAPPSIAKVFNPSSIALNATTSLTFTITHPAANVDALTGVAFTDTLPTGLTVANATATTCGGTVTTTAPTGISLSGATINTNSQCQFSVTVTGAASGQYTNTTGNVTSTNGGTGNTATANLTVAAPPAITKAFGAATIPLNGTTNLTFTINNPNTNVTLTGLAFTDNLPAGLVVASTPNLTNTCGGTATAVGGSGSVSLSAGTVAASATCTVSVSVQGTTSGIKNNSVQITSTEAGAGNTSNSSINVVAPPLIIKAFGATSIPLNGSTSLTFTIQNNNTTAALSGVAFSDTLPAGWIVSTPNGQTGSCGGGTITATQATNVITLSGGTLAASSSCTFSVNVTGTAGGLQTNVTGNVTSTEGGTGGTAAASVKVEAPPSIAKAFNPSGIALNATTSLTFTIANPAANVDALTGVAFTDTLPTGLTVANATATICGGTVTTTAPTGISLSGATISTNGQCQFSVTVTGAASGQYTNTTGNVNSTNGGTGNAASANLAVATPPAITKAFGAATIPLNGTTSLTFTINNPNTNVVLTGLAFTDSLPSGLVVSGTPNLTNTCGGTATAVGGSGSVSLSGGALASSASCTVSVNVQGTTAGIKNNSVQVTSTEGGTGNTSNTSVTVVAPPVIIKAFGAASIPLNGSTSLTFTVQNINATTALNGVAFSDTLPAGLVVATPNGLTGSCGGGTITATQAMNVISLAGATLAASSSCTFSVNVTGTAGGLQNNTTGNVTSTQGGTGGTASASLKVEAPPTISKSFSPPAIALGATTTLTFTITNPAANVDPLTGVSFTDTLPTGLTVPNVSATVCGGTVTLTAPTGIAMSGATINANNQCQFSVTVTGAASGQYTNTTGNVTSTNGGTGNAASANLTVATPPTITKLFGAAAIPLNGTTSLTFNISNPNTNVTLTGLAFTDSLPSGLVVAGTPNLTNTCGGTATAVGGSGSVSLSGGTLASSTSCSVTLSIQGVTAGIKNNSVQITSIDGGAGNTSNASITVVAPPAMVKAFGAASIPLNGTTSLSFTLQNNNATTSLTGIAFSDTLPAGLVIATPNGLTGSCGGTVTAGSGTGSISLSGGSLSPTTQCLVSVNVAGVSAGTKNNTSGAVSSNEGGTGGATSASIAVVAPPSIGKTFSEPLIPLNGTTTLTFTITNPSTNTVALSGVAFTDNLPVGLAVPNSSAAVCGGTLITTAPAGITLSGATIAAGGSCQFNVTVTGAVSTNYTNTTGVVTSANGGTGNSASANLSVGVSTTVGTDPTGLRFSIDGIFFTATQTQFWAVGSTHVIATETPQSSRFNFVSWSDGGAISHTVTAPATAVSYIAKFVRLADAQTIDFPLIPNQILGAPPFTVNVTASSGLPVTLTILSGPATVSGHTITVTGVGHVVVEATQPGDSNTAPAPPVSRSFDVFAAPVYTLMLNANPPQGGTVSATPPGPSFTSPTNVQVQAQANTGWLFIGFTGDLTGLTNPQMLAVSQPRIVTANFAQISTDPRDQVTFGMFSGGPLPGSQLVPLPADLFHIAARRNAVQKGISEAGTAVLVIPATGGDWLSASLSADSSNVQLSLISTVVASLKTGTYISYVLVTSTTGSQRVLTVKLLVDVDAVTSIVDSAGYRSQSVAPEELVTLFGVNAAERAVKANALPLDTNLGGTSVTLTDSAGVTRAAQLLYVSPTQVNLLTPAGMASGAGMLTLTNSADQKASLAIQVDAVAPGLFSADQTGKGVAAAVVLRVAASGASSTSLAATCDSNTGQCVPNAIDLSNSGDQVYVSLYGTGIRGRSTLAGVRVTVAGSPVDVQYAGSQSEFPGLDQINIKLPSSLAGQGDAAIVVTVDGHAANPVTVRLR
jgi:uncharacterized repeat protein (TIGR01451 family)/fimbrial isopeptide formation D2 family protein